MAAISRRPSPDDARRHLADIGEALTFAHDGQEPPGSCVALPPGLDRSLLRNLPFSVRTSNCLTFSVRTSNCLTAADLFSGTDPVSVKDLLTLRHFGQTSLRNLLLVVEDYLKECIENQDNQDQSIETALPPSPDDARRQLADLSDALSVVHDYQEPPGSCVALPSGFDRSLLKDLPLSVRTSNCLAAAELFDGNDQLSVKNLLDLPGFGHTSLRNLLFVIEKYLQKCIDNKDHIDPWKYAKAALNQLLVAASDLHGADSVADLLAPDVVKLASMLGVQDNLRALDVDSVSTTQTMPSAVVLAEAERLYDSLPSTYRTVLDRRVLASPPDTLAKVGDRLGVSRERVRQMHAKLTKKIEILFGAKVRMIASVFRTQLGDVARERDVDSRINGLVADDGTPTAALARHVLKSSLGYSRTMNGVCLDESACLIVEQLQRAAPSFAEDGIIDQTALKSVLPDMEWEQHWELLLKCCAFHDIFGFAALRYSEKARTKAALLAIGTPATREEIAELCGLDPAKIGSYLSSFPNVVRADKSRWGLSEWIDDEYEGIEAEIIQRIEEGGGITTTNRLVKELPAKFGVSASSVNAYLQSPKFVLDDNGHVTLAGMSPVRPTAGNIRIPHLPNEWKVQTKLRCGAICGFNLMPRIASGLLRVRGVSLLELYFYLEHEIEDDRLSVIIKTNHDRQVIRTAYAQFYDALLRSRRDGRLSSDSIEWIVPRDYTCNRSQIDRIDATEIACVLERSFDNGSIAEDANEWLLWMPLAVLTHLRAWRAPRINSLHRALLKLARDTDWSTNAYYPWEPAFNPETRFIPIQALYQYEPNDLTLSSIEALRHCGLMSINDLRCLHPNAVAAAKHTDQPLLRLYRTLQPASGKAILTSDNQDENAATRAIPARKRLVQPAELRLLRPADAKKVSVLRALMTCLDSTPCPIWELQQDLEPLLGEKNIPNAGKITALCGDSAGWRMVFVPNASLIIRTDVEEKTRKRRIVKTAHFHVQPLTSEEREAACTQAEEYAAAEEKEAAAQADADKRAAAEKRAAAVRAAAAAWTQDDTQDT